MRVGSIAHLEIETDVDSDWGSTRVVARLVDGSVATLGGPSSTSDNDEKRAFVAGFEDFKAGGSPHWEATYGTSGLWFSNAAHVALVLVALLWLATRKRIRLTRFGDRVVIEQMSLLRRRRSAEARLEDISGLDHDENGVLQARLRDGSSIAIGSVSASRERAIGELLHATLIDAAS
jgi:hypothetical protein